jgi:RNA polymerase sigma factor (TIGR02999 family)
MTGFSAFAAALQYNRGMLRDNRPAGIINSVQFTLLIPRLRALAARLLSQERPGHTLQATVLVHEAFLKLSQSSTQVIDKRHLFNLSARAMRQVLVDYGRARGNYRRLTLDAVATSLPFVDTQAKTDTVIAVRSTFRKLQQADPAAAGTLRLRFVQGLTIPEISRLQGRPEWRVRADCDFGLSWIRARLSNAPRK